MIWSWIKRRYTKYVDDQKKIEKILKQLNGGTVEGDWKPAEGYHVMPVANFTSAGVDFNLDKGLPIKNFTNEKTGEVRSFVFRAAIEGKYASL